MNKQQAHEQGLHFTGVYSSDKEEVKTRIAEDRKKYPKARIVLVNEPYSKLSRSGPGMGYSAYADDLYAAYDTIERALAWQRSKLSIKRNLQKNKLGS